MAVDLSTLSDEQLDAYKSLLASKQPPTLVSEGSTDASARGAGPVPAVSAPSMHMEHSHPLGLGSADELPDPHHVSGQPVQMSTPFVGGGSAVGALIPSAVGYGVGSLGHAAGLPDWANTGLALASGMLTHGAGKVITDPEVQDAAMAFNPYKKALNLGTAVLNQFRGPIQGPDASPQGYKSPYPTLPYEKPLPALGPRPAFEGHDFTPRVFENSEPVGQPGAVLPSGSVVGPAPPSRVNPPLPSGNAPRIPGWQRMPITGESLPGRDLSPVYPSSPILESGRVIGPRPSLASEPSRGTVVNGPSQSTAKPVISQPDLDTLNQQLRDSLKARGVPVSDTPNSARTRAVDSRAKFDTNGKRNQLKLK